MSEAGASGYPLLNLPSKELPDLDVTIRGAVSIARRLQDPLAELVKIDPKSIGVGQYQHDVSQSHYAFTLTSSKIAECGRIDEYKASNTTVGSCLVYRAAWQSIVNFRDAKGMFKSRSDLCSVPRLGDKRLSKQPGFCAS